MATVDISMPASDSARVITVGWNPFPPVHHDPPAGYDSAYSHYPLLVEPSKTAWTPRIIPCCDKDGRRGDVNMSGTINVADITYLVAYLKQKPPGSPPPPACP
jgi:hypothetical protein